VHRRDLAATIDVAALVEQAGGDTELVMNVEDMHGVGSTTEFCIGGPLANRRAQAHLSRYAPGFHVNPWPEDPTVTMTIGESRFEQVIGEEEYALIFKILIGGNPKAPVWVICGQVAVCNQAAARYLRRNLRQLRRRFGTDRPFCLAIRVINSQIYGYEHVEEVGDLTEAAFAHGPAH
jgi:hypothetical protein